LGNRTKKKKQTKNKTKKPNAFPPPPFPLLLLVLTGRCLDHGEGADGSRIVSTYLAPGKGSRLCTCWWRIQLSRLGLRLFFKFALYVCVCITVCVYIYIRVRVRVCVCVFIHTYMNIYIYMFLNGFHSPAAGSSEARACIGCTGLAEKHSVLQRARKVRDRRGRDIS